MTIRETSRLGSLIVRRLEKHGKLREKWCPERLEKPTETIGHREPAQTSERYFRRLQQDIIVFKFRSGKPAEKAPEQALPPICFSFKDRHYRSLRRPQHDTIR